MERRIHYSSLHTFKHFQSFLIALYNLWLSEFIYLIKFVQYEGAGEGYEPVEGWDEGGWEGVGVL